MRQVNLIKWSTIASGEVIFSLEEPSDKFIDGVRYIETTPDFKRFCFMRADSIQRIGKVTRDIPK